MDGYPTSLTDEAVDREIDRLLNVQPSGDFMARLRTRIDRERVRTRWFGARETVIAGTGVIVVVILALWLPRSQPVRVDHRALVEDQPVATGNVKNLPPIGSDRHLQGAARVSVPPRAVQSPAGASVVISRDDVRGLRHFVSALRDGHLDPAVVPTDGDEREPPMPIVIKPMTVEPLLSASDIQIGELQ